MRLNTCKALNSVHGKHCIDVSCLIVISLNYHRHNHQKMLTRWLPGNTKRPEELSHISFGDLGSSLLFANEDVYSSPPLLLGLFPPLSWNWGKGLLLGSG